MQITLRIGLISTAVVAVMVLALTGCAPATPTPGGAIPTGSSSSGPSTPPSPNSAPQAQTASGPLNGVPAHCLPIADVTAALGVPLTSVRPSAGLGSLNCPYQDGAATTLSSVSISYTPTQPGETGDQYEALLKQYNQNVTVVPGVGDAAFSFTSNAGNSLGFISGKTIVLINDGTSTASPTQLTTFAQKIITG